jgi:hypothetical protein
MADQCIRQGWVCFRLVPFVFNLALACVYRNRRPFTLLESRRRFAFQFHKARAPDISLCAISGLGLDNSLSTHVIELLCSVSIDCFVVGRVVGRRINCYIYLYKTMTCGSLWRKRQESNPTSHFDSSSTALKAARPTGDDALPGTMIPNPVAMAMGKCTRIGFYLAGMVIFWQLAG